MVNNLNCFYHLTQAIRIRITAARNFIMIVWLNQSLWAATDKNVAIWF